MCNKCGIKLRYLDESYWLRDMPDKRAISFWISMDGTTEANGCMCFVPEWDQQQQQQQKLELTLKIAF
jgi:ectoine hydroxylase-related dioxygenase (phytanoyl-CoA dioxygenase family)